MEAVLVGAPGSGARSIARSLASRHGAHVVDLTGEPSRRADALAGLRRSGKPAAADGPLTAVIAADRIIGDPSIRARLYSGRHVIWLDVAPDQLVERLRAVRAADLGIEGDIRTFIADHLATYRPYYLAGRRIDASGSVAAAISQIEPLLAQPLESGTLVLRIEVRGGLIELGEGILGRSLDHVLGRLAVRRCAVITSARDLDRAGVAVDLVRAIANVPVEVDELPDGERSKQLEEQERLFRRLARHRLERGDPLIAIGDDALLEAATFAAAVWLRGVPLIAIPVTTLGLIDTSIGGKGGIDLPGVGRNLLGAIHQPVATILDVGLVEGESVTDRRSALAEAVKIGLIADAGLLSLLETVGQAMPGETWPQGSELLELVERCALAKRRLVLLDERDTGDVRAALNLGHTLSHALEAATGFQLRHGEAVAYGLRAALDIGTSMGVTPAAIAARATRLLDRLDLATERLDVPVADVLDYIEADKKRREGRLRWVLVGLDGVTLRDDIPPSIVHRAVVSALAGHPSHPRSRT